MNASQKIAIFGPDDGLINLCTALLTSAGYSVTKHNSQTLIPKSVVSKLLEERPNLSLLPVNFGHKVSPKEGIDASVMIRQNPELQTLPVIMYSNSDEYRQEAIQKGANDYLGPDEIKRLDDILLEKVRQLIG